MLWCHTNIHMGGPCMTIAWCCSRSLQRLNWEARMKNLKQSQSTSIFWPWTHSELNLIWRRLIVQHVLRATAFINASFLTCEVTLDWNWFVSASPATQEALLQFNLICCGFLQWEDAELHLGSFFCSYHIAATTLHPIHDLAPYVVCTFIYCLSTTAHLSQMTPGGLHF